MVGDTRTAMVYFRPFNPPETLLLRCDKILVIQTSPRRSEGMLIEIGVAMARDKSILLAQHQSAAGKSYLPDLARRTQTWHSESELDTTIITLIKSECD